MDYVKELRQLVGTRPLILTGSCVLIVDKQGRLLMHHRSDNDLWGFPGGIMELGETLEETARREVQEETGLTVRSLRLLDVFSGQELYYKYPHGDEVYNVTAAYFTANYDGELNADNAETKALRFYAPTELPSNVSPSIRPILDRFLQEMKKSPSF